MNIGVLASHGGSNLQAILDAIQSGRLPAKVSLVISNNPGAFALERAKSANIQTMVINSKSHPDDSARDVAIADALEAAEVEWVVLAGYMKKLGTHTLSRFRNRILNIHPALLPKFGGQGMYGINVHKAVVESGEKETGPTVHLVDEVYDHGQIVAQARVPVLPTDTPEELSARVLKAEHLLFPETLAKLARGEINLCRY